MNVLTRKEEQQILEKLKSNARRRCTPEIQEFVDCSFQRLVSVAWACRRQQKLMNSCLKQYTTQEEQDKLKLQFISEKRNQEKKKSDGKDENPGTTSFGNDS